MGVFGADGLRKLVKIYYMLLAMGGLGLAILSLTLLVNGPLMALTPVGFLIGGMIVGILLAMVSLLTAITINRQSSPSSLSNTGNNNRRLILLGPLLLLFVLLAGSIIGVIFLEGARRPNSIHNHLNQLWDNAPIPTILQIQTWGQCCGFASYQDRFQDPCTQYQEEVGCWNPMSEEWEKRLSTLWGPATIVVMGEALGVVLGLLVMWIRWREEKQASLVGERQPFDAWHKAVFQ